MVLVIYKYIYNNRCPLSLLVPIYTFQDLANISYISVLQNWVAKHRYWQKYIFFRALHTLIHEECLFFNIIQCIQEKLVGTLYNASFSPVIGSEYSI